MSFTAKVSDVLSKIWLTVLDFSEKLAKVMKSYLKLIPSVSAIIDHIASLQS